REWLSLQAPLARIDPRRAGAAAPQQFTERRAERRRLGGVERRGLVGQFFRQPALLFLLRDIAVERRRVGQRVHHGELGGRRLWVAAVAPRAAVTFAPEQRNQQDDEADNRRGAQRTQDEAPGLSPLCLGVREALARERDLDGDVLLPQDFAQ